MVTGDGCGGGGICDVGAMGSLLAAGISRVCLLLSGREWQILCHRRLGLGLSLWGGEVNCDRESEYSLGEAVARIAKLPNKETKSETE